MQDVLPKGKIKPTRINPKISIFYGLPKVGKTSILSELDNCITLDTEGGADMYEMSRLRITSISGATTYNDDGSIKTTSIDNFIAMVMADAQEQIKKGVKVPQYPYPYIAIDTLDELEEMCITSATAKFKMSTIGKTFKENSVLELPQGGGYYHLRNEVLLQIDRLASVCKYLILVSHVKDKLLNKGGIEVSAKDISLTGKLGSIVAAKADIIGYLYREPGKPLMVSFEAYENTSVMGARIPRLAGKRFEMKWDTIFLAEPSK